MLRFGKITYVKMHRMGSLEVVLNDKIDPLVGRTLETDSIREYWAGIVELLDSCHGLESWLLESDINGLVGASCVRIF